MRREFPWLRFRRLGVRDRHKSGNCNHNHDKNGYYRKPGMLCRKFDIDPIEYLLPSRLSVCVSAKACAIDTALYEWASRNPVSSSHWLSGSKCYFMLLRTSMHIPSDWASIIKVMGAGCLSCRLSCRRSCRSFLRRPFCYFSSWLPCVLSPLIVLPSFRLSGPRPWADRFHN
jgi:hypothetical protein